MATSVALQIEELYLKRGTTTLFDGLNLRIPQGSVSALMGPGGAGKSTLLLLVAGLVDDMEKTQRGRIIIQSRRPPSRGRVALMRQTARNLVRPAIDGLRRHHPERGELGPAGLRSSIEEYLEELGLVGLAARIDEAPIEWSAFERKQLRVATALLTDPDLLCLDEPCAGLDDREARAILDVVEAQRGDRTVLWCTHHHRRARQTADQVSLLAGGRIIETAPVDQFFEEPKTGPAQDFVRSGSCAVPAPDTDEEDLAPAYRSSETDGDSGESESDVESRDVDVDGEDRGNGDHRQTGDFGDGWIDADDVQAVESKVFRRRNAESAHRGPAEFHWVWPGLLGGVAKPGLLRELERDLEALCRVDIGAVVTLTEEELNREAVADQGLAYRHLPIVDMEGPTVEEALDTCRWVDDQLRRGRPVVYHCRAGIGRTGTMLACQIMATVDAEPVPVIEYLRSICSRYVQSKAQERFLEQFWTSVRSKQPAQ